MGKMLQEMLQFYLPNRFLLLQGLQPAVIDRLLGDEDMGLLMTQTDCAVALDETERTAWICGKRNTEVQQRIDEITRLAATQQAAGGEPPIKRRRTAALTVHSEAHSL